MLLTIRDLSSQLQIKPSTLYAWVAQGKIPYRKIHGLVRFHPTDIEQWLESCSRISRPSPTLGFPGSPRLDVDRLIARAKREVYTARGETRLRSSLIGKEERDGAREAE